MAPSGETHVSAFAPGVWLLRDDALFTEGAAASAAIEEMAEEGDPGALLDGVDPARGGTVSDLDVMTYRESPLEPGDVREMELVLEPGDRLAFAIMYGASNDTFVAPPGGLFAIHDASGDLAPGDLTSQLLYFDAGTEGNEPLGHGEYQPGGEPGGPEGEGSIVAFTADDDLGAEFPAITDVLRVELELLD